MVRNSYKNTRDLYTQISKDFLTLLPFVRGTVHKYGIHLPSL